MRKVKQSNTKGTLSIKIIESYEDFVAMLHRNFWMSPQFTLREGRLQITFDGVDVIYIVEESNVKAMVNLNFADGGGLFEM